MPLPPGAVIGILSDNLRRRGTVLPIPRRRITGWARGLDLPAGGTTVLYTGQMYQLIPYIEAAVAMMDRVGDTPIAAAAALGRRVNRIVNLAVALRPSTGARAPYDAILADVVGLLRAAGVEFGYLYSDDMYSGALAHDLGLNQVVAEHARRVTAMFRRRGVTDVITVDPHTTTMLRSVYPTLVDGYDLRVRSYLEVLAEAHADADADGVPAASPNSTAASTAASTVALHDSCVFARYENVLSQPRDLLARAGVIVGEPEASGRDTWCCGGPVEALYPKKALANAGVRVAQLRQVAPTGVTMCPLCLVNLRKAAGDTMRFDDISHYLRQGDTT